MKPKRHKHLLAAVLLLAGSAVLLAGCMGGGGTSASTTSSLRQAKIATTIASVADAGQQPIIVAPVDAYSSFQSKDPFVQQQEVTPTTAETAPTNPTPPVTSTTTTTTTQGGGTTSTTTTSSTSTTSTSNPTTSTTSFFSHMLQIIKVGDSDGTPKVTFMVDSSVYPDKVVGDSVSTSWGEIKVLAIDTNTRLVTLSHDGQTVIMRETQFLFE